MLLSSFSSITEEMHHKTFMTLKISLLQNVTKLDPLISIFIDGRVGLFDFCGYLAAPLQAFCWAQLES